ncbi:MAG: hypothetical protein IKW97_07705 [Muribaculaceae bacterium]|nr:hypothetical protein [Muribaculaceae bacterium]
MPVARKNPKDIIDLPILAFVAFTLQRYCGFPTCKAMLQLPSKILQPFQGSNSRASLAVSVDSRTLQAA